MKHRCVWGLRIVGIAVALLLLATYVTGCLSTNTANVTPTPTKTPRPAST